MSTNNQAIERQRGADAADIIRLHREIVAEARTSLAKAIAIGELLVKVKRTLTHGAWEVWYEDTIPQISERSIRNYMRVFKNRELLARQEITDPAAAYKALATPRPNRQPLPVPATAEEPVRSVGSDPVPEPSNEILDRTGLPIPDKALKYWNRSKEIWELMTGISKAISAAEQAQDMRDKLYSEVNFPLLLTDLQNAHGRIKVALPYAVCPTCQGLVMAPCSTCNGRGMVSEHYWKFIVTKDLKDIREKLVAARKGKQ